MTGTSRYDQHSPKMKGGTAAAVAAVANARRRTVDKTAKRKSQATDGPAAVGPEVLPVAEEAAEALVQISEGVPEKRARTSARASLADCDVEGSDEGSDYNPLITLNLGVRSRDKPCKAPASRAMSFAEHCDG